VKRPDPAARYRRLRTAHPVSVLRWLRLGVLLGMLLTLLLCLVVAFVARQKIAEANRTGQAITEIGEAWQAARSASDSLQTAFGEGAVVLTGTGNDFTRYTDQINSDMISANTDNAAGAAGTAQIHFIFAQLDTCKELAESDVREGSATGLDARQCLTDPDQRVQVKVAGTTRTTTVRVPGTGGLTAELTDLQNLESDALTAQRGSIWLTPWIHWWLLLAPVAVMLVLGVASGGILIRHFRRHVGVLLPSALLLTLAVAILVGSLSSVDSRDLPSAPLASRLPVVFLVAIALVAAMLLADRAYRPRLAEYRFPNS
jgi:hypothetical protein